MRALSENRVLTGVIYGAAAWLAYASVETWFTTIIPYLLNPGYDYMPIHRGFTLLLFALYPAIGAVAGALAGAACTLFAGRRGLKERPTEIISAAAVFTVILGFCLNLVILYAATAFSVLLVLLVSLILSVILVLRAYSNGLYRKLSFIANPWTTALLLIGIMWVLKEWAANDVFLTKIGLLAAYTTGILVASIAAAWFFQRGVGLSEERRVALCLAAALVSMAAGFAPKETFLVEAPSTTAVHAGKPSTNVILITMDTVRADHLSLYGYGRDTTPNLRALSREATLYVNSFSSGDMTLSSHASIFTGLYPRVHGAHCDPWAGFPVGRPLADKFMTLTEVLRDKGYSTVGVAANYGYLTPSFNMNQGFEYYYNKMAVPFLRETKPYYIKNAVRDLLKKFSTPFYYDQAFIRAEDINKHVFSKLDEIKEDDRPFFVFINYMDAHDPYIPPPPFDTLYPGKDDDFDNEANLALAEEVLTLKRKISPKEKAHIVSQYDGGISYIDHHIGALVERLKELGLYDNTLIIITSDHGEAFGERDLIGHGVSAYRDQVFVPLIIKFPGKNSQEMMEVAVSSVDILPTVLDVVGVDAPDGVQGASLAGSGTIPSRDIISESFPQGTLVSRHKRFDRVERAIVSWPYKLVVSTNGKRELYDLSSDPEEAVNLHTFDNPVSASLNKSLTEWLASTPTLAVSSDKLSADAVERLKALGYVQ